MKLLIPTVFSVVLASCAPAAAAISFVLMGDSTTATAGGWGDGFCKDVTSGTGCYNRAKGGATTGSFVAGGYFATAIADIKKEAAKGNRVLATLQFGHNDQKIVSTFETLSSLEGFTEQAVGGSGKHGQEPHVHDFSNSGCKGRACAHHLAHTPQLLLKWNGERYPRTLG